MSEADSQQLAGSHVTGDAEVTTPTNEVEQSQLAGSHAMTDMESIAPTNERDQSQQHVSMTQAVDQEQHEEEVHQVEPAAKTKKGKKSKKKSQQEQPLNGESGEAHDMVRNDKVDMVLELLKSRCRQFGRFRRRNSAIRPA